MVFLFNFGRHKHAVSPQSSIAECTCSLLHSGKPPKPAYFPALFNNGIITSRLKGMHALGKALVTLKSSRGFSVYGVLGICGLSQIKPSVIAWVSVDVVNLIFGKSPNHPKKRKAVRKVHFAKHFYLPAPFCVSGTRHRAFLGATSPCCKPSKNPSVWIIIQQIFKLFLGDLGHAKKCTAPCGLGQA